VPEPGKPFESDNDDLDLFACLQHIIEECPSPKARGKAQGLLQARTEEIAEDNT